MTEEDIPPVAIEHLRKFVQFLNEEGETMLEFGEVLPEYKAWLAGSRRQLFTIALYDEDGRCKVDNQMAYTREAAEKKSLLGYAELYPGRTWRVGE